MTKIPCPDCTDGTYIETYMTGDGQPGVPVEIHKIEKECKFCDGTGKVDEEMLFPENEEELE